MSDSGFIFNPVSGDSYSVNPIGQEIIALWKEGKSDEEVLTILEVGYKVERETLEKDLYDFKNMIAKYRLSIES